MLSLENQKLYTDLCALEGKSDAFYSSIQEMNGKKFHIFSYRIASYSDWLHDGALESRGIMFEIEYDNYGLITPLRIASRSMQKFFNISENPFTQNLDYSEIEEIQYKVDGSLISTYLCNGKLYLKSKTSLHSEHCQKAMELLRSDNLLLPFITRLEYLANNNYTVNMELVSPNYPFRIVVFYDRPQLIVLNVRHNETGEYLPREKVKNLFGDYAIKNFELNNLDKNKFIENVSNEIGHEGYIYKFKNIWVKHKTIWYSNLHANKSAISSVRQLFECVVNENSDDLKALFHDDIHSLNLINKMEEKVSKIYNSLVKTVEDFYNLNRELLRKDYAIKGQQILSRLEFPLAMNLYLGKTNDYKQIMIDKYKDLGIRDEAILIQE